MAVQKVIITQAIVDESSCRPRIAGRICDSALEPVSVHNYNCITMSKKGFVGFVVCVRPGEKVNSKLTQLYNEYESVRAESVNKRAALDGLKHGIKYLWPGAEVSNESD